MLNYAIIGFGALGKVHFNCAKEVVKKTGDVRFKALCDVENSTFSAAKEFNMESDKNSLDLSAYNLYNDVEDMLANEKLDFVVTALPTYLHEKTAVQVMEHGIHVFSEKPMAINEESAKNMLAAAKKNNVKLMIGQCLRFWPAYVALKEMIATEKYGKVISADFSRVSPTPGWSWQNWMLDGEKSGGAALDVHVHDVDFINMVFGMPKSVTSVSTSFKTAYDSIRTVYGYDDKVVTAMSDWGLPMCYPFTASFTVRFEKATAEMKRNDFRLYREGGEAEAVELPASSAYAAEVIEFINCIKEDRVSEINPPEASLASLRIALAERKSADENKTILL